MKCIRQLIPHKRCIEVKTVTIFVPVYEYVNKAVKTEGVCHLLNCYEKDNLHHDYSG